MAYCELMLQNNLSLLEVLHVGWLIDVNLAILYLPTLFLLKRIVKIIAIFTFDN